MIPAIPPLIQEPLMTESRQRRTGTNLLRNI
jgi:hypothetical protein